MRIISWKTLVALWFIFTIARHLESFYLQTVTLGEVINAWSAFGAACLAIWFTAEKVPGKG
jgi:hypothetical protein